MSVGDLVVKRLEATRTLQENPADFTALQTLAYIEQKVSLTSVSIALIKSVPPIWVDM